jgi:glycosyltransferase involved in cell wall biosynthesis
VVPLHPSAYPRWFPDIAFDYCETARRGGQKTARTSDTARDEAGLADIIGNADITVATTCDTLAPVTRAASGPKAYFMQHFAPYFQESAQCTQIPGATTREGGYNARSFYNMGMRLIANSSWLKGMVQRLVGNVDIEVCPSAIRQEIFHVERKTPAHPAGMVSRNLTVISYGGREAEWKGFREMAQAVARIREERRDVSLRWKVYGGALIPPKNDIADYEELGYLDQRRLADAYRSSDILLSASWYESFPLFPLEAMACGVATIASAPGTEDYARHRETAHLVRPRDVDSIATGLGQLVDDPSYRLLLARNGATEARAYTWERAVNRMESLLLAAAGS